MKIENIEIQFDNDLILIWCRNYGLSLGNQWEGYFTIFKPLFDYELHYQWIKKAWQGEKKSIDNIPF